MASYTLTIEQTGGSAITVPGWGFLLNNELTDFNFVPLTAGVPDPNLPGPGKRPRSSMSPTIVLKDGRPVAGPRLARRRDDHHHGGADPARATSTAACPWSTPSPRRGCPRATAVEQAEPALSSSSVGAALQARGHVLAAPTAVPPEIGAVTAIRSSSRHHVQAAAEPVRRGGGSAMVVHRSGD